MSPAASASFILMGGDAAWPVAASAGGQAVLTTASPNLRSG